MDRIKLQRGLTNEIEKMKGVQSSWILGNWREPPRLKIAQTASISQVQLEFICSRWKKKRPHVDPIQNLVDDLHQIRNRGLIKNHIVSTISYCPNQCTHSHSNSCLNRSFNPIKPVAKHIVTLVSGGI
jgi:hypothetical protein